MAQSIQPGERHPLVDLLCVAVLGALLWLGAHAIGGIARAAGHG